MDLDPMINTSQDENDYCNYDNRPIRPMDQDALNEALARLPILVDEDENDPDTSLKIRRQPVLAYSTKRKNFSGVNINQSLLNMSGTPISNKRKLGGSTPTNKFIKQLDSRHDLIQLKEENKILEETKGNLQLEFVLLKKSHETELEILKQEHQQTIDTLVQQHNLQCEQFNTSLADKEQLLIQTNLELESLRNDQTMLLLEKDTLDKIVNEYQLMKEEMNQKLIENETIIKNLREEVANLTKNQQQVKSTLSNGRMPLKESSTDRSRTPNKVVSINKSNVKSTTTRGPVCPLSTVTSSLNKPISKSKLKSNLIIDDKKKFLTTDKLSNSSRIKPKIISTK